MIHISPWEAALALVAGAARILPAGGVLVTYGPYMRGGAHTSESNEAFDASLRARDPLWGVRDSVISRTQRRVGRDLTPDRRADSPPLMRSSTCSTARCPSALRSISAGIHKKATAREYPPTIFRTVSR